MAYKDKAKQRQATKERVRRHRARVALEALRICKPLNALPALQEALPTVTVSTKPSVAPVPERLEELTQIIRHPIETPVTAGHKVSAVAEMNKMEGIYTSDPSSQPVVITNFIFKLPDGTRLPIDQLLRLESGNSDQRTDTKG